MILSSMLEPRVLLSKQGMGFTNLATANAGSSPMYFGRQTQLSNICRKACNMQDSQSPTLAWTHRPLRAGASLRDPLIASKRLGIMKGGGVSSGLRSHRYALRRLVGFGLETRVFRTKGPLPPRRAVCSATYVSAPGPVTIEEEDISEEELETEEVVEGKKPEPVIAWGVVGSIVGSEKLRVAKAVGALVICSYCTLSLPIYSGGFFQSLIGKSTVPLWRLLANITVAYILEPLMTIVFVTNVVYIWEKVMSTLRERVFSRLLVQRVEFFDRHKVSELTSLLSVEMKVLQDMVNDNVSRDRGFRAISELMGALIILFSISPQLAPPLVIVIVSLSVGLGVYRRRIASVLKAYLATQGKLAECASETFGAIRTVRLFSGESRQISMFQTQVDACRQNGEHLSWTKSSNEAWTRLGIYISMLCLYILGGNKVKSGELSIGVLLSFVGYTFTLTFAVQGLMNTLTDLRSVMAATERINTLTTSIPIDEALAVGIEREMRGEIKPCPDDIRGFDPPELRDHLERFVRDGGGDKGLANGDKADGLGKRLRGSERGRLAIIDGVEHWISAEEVLMEEAGRKKGVCELAWTGDIILEGVHFAYPMRPDLMVLRGLTMRMKRGTVTALVGASGSGKSTIVQLLSRFYAPTVGRITLDGIDVRLFDKAEWTRAVSVVNQEPVLFAMSIADNIAYALPEGAATRESIVKAAKAANAHDFIEKLPQGYDTNVGERGGLLSGGQKQRIAIARALLKNAPILVLDEATSALDSVSERLVQEALEYLMKGRTTLVIAHRLSTVQKADKIVVMSLGKVVEVGTHEELIASGGDYSTLVNNQRLILSS